jgi:hypothetical protein
MYFRFMPDSVARQEETTLSRSVKMLLSTKTASLLVALKLFYAKHFTTPHVTGGEYSPSTSIDGLRLNCGHRVNRVIA